MTQAASCIFEGICPKCQTPFVRHLHAEQLYDRERHRFGVCLGCRTGYRATAQGDVLEIHSIKLFGGEGSVVIDTRDSEPGIVELAVIPDGDCAAPI